MKKEVIKTPMAPFKDEAGKPRVPASRVIKANGFVFIGGTPPLDPATGELIGGDMVTQTRRVLENIKLLLESAGSSMDLVVKSTLLCSNVAYFDDINRVYGEYFPTDPPVRTFITVGSWPRKFDIEMEVIALAGA